MADYQQHTSVKTLAAITLASVTLVVGLTIWLLQMNERPKKEEAIREVRWTELREYDFKKHSGPAWLLALNGTSVKIAGYVVPMESRPVTKEFVFVPDQLACIHVPPPPPNLMIYVHMDKEVTLEELAGPQWITGTLGIADAQSPFGQISYTLQAHELSPYRML